MKKILFLTLFSIAFTFLNAQTIDDAKKQMYYERYESAKKILETIIATDNASPDAYYWLGKVFLKQVKPDLAKATFQSGIDYATKKEISVKKAPLVYIGKARILLDEGDATASSALMDETLKAGKYKDKEALLAAGRAHIDSKNGDPNWAIDILKRAVKRDKKNPEVYTTLGDAYRKVIDGASAVKIYDEALGKDGSYAEAMYKKGLIYKTQKNEEIYLQRFTQAYAMDSTYTPANYELFYFYYFRDVNKAAGLLNAFIRHSDPSPQHKYMVTDMQYVSKKYKEAIASSNNIIAIDGNKTEPRIYKLLAYSNAALGDSSSALNNMNTYFEKQKSKDIVAKDYELKAQLIEKLSTDKSEALVWYKKALAIDTVKKDRLEIMGTLADLNKELGNRENEAMWRENIFTKKAKPSNLDIYNWGLALYSAENYKKADSVFKLYEEKYPDQIYGYMWRARSNAQIDTTMSLGLAVPHYIKLAQVASKDSIKNKALLLRSYNYLGIYEANITKDYPASLGYFEKILQLDPDNSEALRLSTTIKKWIEKGTTSSN